MLLGLALFPLLLVILGLALGAQLGRAGIALLVIVLHGLLLASTLLLFYESVIAQMPSKWSCSSSCDKSALLVHI